MLGPISIEISDVNILNPIYIEYRALFYCLERVGNCMHVFRDMFYLKCVSSEGSDKITWMCRLLEPSAPRSRVKHSTTVRATMLQRSMVCVTMSV